MKALMWIFETVVKLLKNKTTIETLVAVITKIMVDEVADLEGMTIAELRNVAKANGISLEGKRVKGEIIEILENELSD